MRRWLKRAAVAAALLAGLAIAAGLGGTVYLRSRLARSLPILEGSPVLAGLESPVVVERDALGVPAIRAAGRLDLARALGFLHAQDRFFQMDLLRRHPAGEMAELLGTALVGHDRALRVHRFRDVARRVVARSGDRERALVAAYTEGVNTGLAALGAPPFEYAVLRTDPASWKEEDVALVLLAMFVDLHDEDGSHESALGVMRDVLPPALFDFLAPRGTEWDAPVVGGPPPPVPVPGPEVIDLRRVEASSGEARAAGFAEGDGGSGPGGFDPEAPASEEREGSNNFAVAGRLTAHGGALLANDMHLGLSVPNIWYRAAFEWHDGESPAGEHRVTGVTLPGAPVMVVGSNGRVAWGFTNSYGDWTDLIVLGEGPGGPGTYLTPGGPKAFDRAVETIHVRGGADETLEVLGTIWGPVLDEDHLGRRRAFRWTAYDPEAVDFEMIDLEEARDLREAFDAARRSGAPPQNFVAADAEGRVGWTIFGAIPRRFGHDGRLPSSWADGSRGWDGYLDPADYPEIADPPSGLIWTANARVVEGEMLAAIGDGGYDLGARARQIRDDLAALRSPAERDLLGVQLDDRALFLARWRDLLLAALTPAAVASNPDRAEFRRLVEDWGGRASVDSVGFRLVRAFRSFLSEQVFAPLTAPCTKADERFRYGEIHQEEGPLWSLVTGRPAHLLDPKRAGWDDQILAAVDAAIEYFVKDGSRLEEMTWGRRNAARIQHPFSLGLPLAGRWLDMPREPLPGDTDMPRVQGPTFGASQRMVVSPGREAEGILHMPCGQSANPRSPHYADGHGAWARGEPAPFLPGPPVHTLTLVPASVAP